MNFPISLNQFRPDGTGLERLLGGSNVEIEVFSRLKRIFMATSSSWKPGELYFTIRHYKPVDTEFAATIANNFLKNFKEFAEHIGNAEVAAALENLTIQTCIAAEGTEDEVPSILMYECLTDFLAKQQPDRHELFRLKEACYSIANDYFLMAYILWPAMRFTGELSHAMDAYLDVWRCGITLKFFDKGIVVVGLPD